MRKLSVALGVLAFLFSVIINPGYGRASATRPPTKTVDVNKDGKLDVTYYGDGEHVSKVEADTNYDGKPDVVVHLKDGEFQSAEADTDHNGTMDKKFSDVKEFNAWLNENNPEFEENLNRPDWEWKLLKF